MYLINNMLAMCFVMICGQCVIVTGCLYLLSVSLLCDMELVTQYGHGYCHMEFDKEFDTA